MTHDPATPRRDSNHAYDPAEYMPAAPRISEPGRGSPMQFIHSRRYLQEGQVVQLDCDTQCNFMLLTDADFAAYQLVRQFRYHGGTFKHFPAHITVPESGDWNIIIDLAGAQREIHYNIVIVTE